MKKKLILFIIFLILLLYLLLISMTSPNQFIISEEPINLKTASWNIKGTLKIPVNKKPIPLALIIAGSGPTDRNGNSNFTKNNSLKYLSDELYYDGIASLSFDKRGVGESKGIGRNEADLRFEDYIEDVKQWINLLSKDKRFSEIIVIGHSEGSLIGMIASINNPKITKFISIAGTGMPAGDILKKQMENEPENIQNIIFNTIDKLELGQTVSSIPPSLNYLFRPSVQPYLISWFKYNPQKEITKLHIPSLIIQGTTDIQVSLQDAELLTKGNNKAKKVIIENMDHVLKESKTKNKLEQLNTTYSNPNIPLKEELIKSIVDFIKT